MGNCRMKTGTLIAAASLGCLGLMAAAAAQAANGVELKNVAARVVVTPEARSDVELKVVYGAAKLPIIMVHTADNTLVADGKLKMRSINCKADGAISVSGVRHWNAA